MNKLLVFFSPKQQLTLYETQKIKALLILCLTLIVLVVPLIGIELITKAGSANIPITLTAISFIILNLVILKKWGIKPAGNVFSVVALFFQLLALNTGSEETLLYFATQGYHLSIAFLILGALFASWQIIVANSLLILTSSVRLFLLATATFPEQKQMISVSFTHQTLSLIIVSLILLFTMKFSRQAIQSAKQHAEVNEKQSGVLRHVFNEIKAISAKISETSRKVASNAVYVSKNSTEQTKATNDISDSIEKIYTSINSITEKAKLTGEITKTSADQIKESSLVFNQTIDYVSEIRKKTAIISDLAFQTNILSINASIEAAHAGDTGRGFTIVAQEVGKLSTKSQTASEEIKDISDFGQNISELAGQKLRDLNSEINKSAEYAKEMSDASLNQKNGIELINNLVKQLSDSGLLNASSAGELSSSAQELLAHSQQLEELILISNTKN